MPILHNPRTAKSERKIGLSQLTIAMLVILVLLVSAVIVYLSQIVAEQSAFTITPPVNVTTPKEQYEIAKLAAEIRQIRSDTSGSLFWLKMIALFVTVGGAIGGYLIGQSRSTRTRIEFEDRKNVDTAYQSIVQELSDKSALLRAAAAVKLGMILKSFPHEWNVNGIRREQLIDLTKQVLASSLSIENESKVLKTLTSAIALHHPWENDSDAGDRTRYGDLRGVDLSSAKGCDAYWARVDFTYADFYRADLTQASFREAILHGAQFREAILKEAVFMNADCEGANFKFADLRNANLTGAILKKASFEGAKVYGAILTHAKFGDNPNLPVDNSPAADGGMMIPFQEWLAMHSQVSSIATGG